MHVNAAATLIKPPAATFLKDTKPWQIVDFATCTIYRKGTPTPLPVANNPTLSPLLRKCLTNWLRSVLQSNVSFMLSVHRIGVLQNYLDRQNMWKDDLERVRNAHWQGDWQNYSSTTSFVQEEDWLTFSSPTFSGNVWSTRARAMQVHPRVIRISGKL